MFGFFVVYTKICFQHSDRFTCKFVRTWFTSFPMPFMVFLEFNLHEMDLK